MLLLIGFMLPTLAQAAPFVCFTSKPKSVVEYMHPDNTPEIYLAKLSCETIERVSTGLQATSIALSVGGLYAACTGVGVAATVVLEGGAIAIQAVDLIVGNLPCNNSAREKEIKQMAELVVCEELGRQGIKCSLRR